MKSSEYAKTLSFLQQDVEMRATTTMGSVSRLTPEPAG